VQCQTLLPSETGSQTFADVTGIWSIQARREGADLLGRPAVRAGLRVLSSRHSIATSSKCARWYKHILYQEVPLKTRNQIVTSLVRTESGVPAYVFPSTAIKHSRRASQGDVLCQVSQFTTVRR